MEGLGKESSICSSKPFPWLGHPETQTSSRLWKLTDCFSTHEKTTNYAAKQKSYMDGRTPVLELKDVPPPPHHASSSKPFPLPLVPLPPHSLPASLLQDTLQAPQPQGGSPKVSLCTLCEHCSAGRYGGFSGGAGCTSSSSSSSSAGVSLYTSSSFQESHSSSSIQTRPSACLLGTALQSHQQYPSLGAGGNVLSTVHSSGGYQVQISSSVATSQPYTSHSHLSCCAGLFHSHPSVSLPYSQACMLPTLAPSLPDGLHSSCLVSSYPVGVGCSPTAREIHRNTVVSAARGDFHTTTTPAHLCSNPLHLNVDCTVCLQGSHYCRHCLTKPVRGLMPNPDKVWPNIPLPAHQSVPVPIPMCNGCGTSSEARLLLGPGIGMAGQKYGSPESGVPENVPPVGVFWDIENCCVPTGRSAAAVVQRIRSRFFQGHREAEFICVCDISKENKAVIQELNNCQVTVAHINATAKNAADDKLRQSLRRFAETHTAPATVVLVSSDVNFASELSDLRHRHGFQVVLVHKNQASPALLLHAHRHVAFEEITAELPPRMADKSQSSSNLLYVHNLPVNCFEKNVRSRLRRLSDNCGGKVLGLSSGTAVLRFGSHEAAERARKRMGNEDVFGCRISLSFSHQHDEDTIEPQPCQSTSVFPPPPPAFPFLPLDKPRSPRRSRRAARLYQTASSLASSSTVPERPYSPRRGCSGPPGGAPVLTKPFQELCGLEAKPKTGSHPLEKGRAASSSPHRISPDITQQQQHLKPALLGESMYRRRRDVSSPCNAPESPVQRVSRNSPEFQVSTPSAFSKLSIQRPFSPTVLPQGSWSSRSLSPSLSSRSSPLLVPPRSSGPQGFSEPFSDGADIQVANLDYRMSRKELQQILCDTFSRHGRVKAVELSPHTDYQLKATVQMMSLQQAISAVSGLHRCKIGGKRIHVSLMTGGSNKSLTMLSSEIISILHDAPASCLPLFKFTEIYEKKFAHKLVVNDLYRLPEVVAVREQGGTRLLCLLPSGLARQSPLGSSQSQDSSSASGSPVVFEELEYHEPVCRHHYLQQVFSEADFDPDLYQIPFVALSLKALASQVHSLLQTHEGMVPLLSFPECYAAEFTRLPLGHEGVPLEHLITCIPGITIVTAQNGFKVIKWIHNKPPAPNADPWVQRCKSPVGNPQLIQFSREVIDLMKSHPSCILPISKFIPAYHHHFAKQCRVSDYGYTKLLELLEAVPHVLQILGMGTKRLLTLTHRAQVKRFTQDLLKLLKFQASKQVVIRDFMQAYHWCYSKDWNVIDYGMCDLMDLLTEIPDTTITISQQDNDTVISVPKRERTMDEVERTKQFGKEVVDLLRHQPHCRMPFSKFIPTYHHHFGRQCKLTYYGFSKLLELFEAIPDVLQVLECGEEKVLMLTELERVKALAAQLVKLLRAQRDSSLPAGLLLSEYSKTFGYGLRLQDYDVSSLPALLNKLCHVVKVVDVSGVREVQLISRKSLRSLTCQLLALLMSLEEPRVEEGIGVEELGRLYAAAHGAALNPCEYGFLSLSELLKSLPYLVELFHEQQAADEGECGAVERVRLTRLYQFARSVRGLLHTYHYHQIFLTEFPGAYSKFTGRSLQPRAYGYASMDDLLSAVPQVVWIKGHGHKRIIVLKNDMRVRSSSAASDSPQPDNEEEEDEDEDEGELSQRDSPYSEPDSRSSGEAAVDSELLCLTSPVDLLCGPVPSCLPSPQLHPDPVLLRQDNLILFDEHSRASAEGDDAVDVDPMVVDEARRPPEQQSSPAVDCEQQPGAAIEPAAAKTAQPSSINMSSIDSPLKRAPRTKVKLAANFSFPAAHR